MFIDAFVILRCVIGVLMVRCVARPATGDCCIGCHPIDATLYLLCGSSYMLAHAIHSASHTQVASNQLIDYYLKAKDGSGDRSKGDNDNRFMNDFCSKCIKCNLYCITSYASPCTMCACACVCEWLSCNDNRRQVPDDETSAKICNNINIQCINKRKSSFSLLF